MKKQLILLLILSIVLIKPSFSQNSINKEKKNENPKGLKPCSLAKKYIGGSTQCCSYTYDDAHPCESTDATCICCLCEIIIVGKYSDQLDSLKAVIKFGNNDKIREYVIRKETLEMLKGFLESKSGSNIIEGVKKRELTFKLSKLNLKNGFGLFIVLRNDKVKNRIDYVGHVTLLKN